MTHDRTRLASPGAAASDESAGTSPASKVLLVEDEFLIAFDIETALREAGFDVVGVARSADQAVALAQTMRPALMVMDIRLDGKRDGIDAALDIYRDSGIRSIFATAHCDAATVARAELAHPLGWLPKPYTTAALVRMVKQALASL